jgi:hypothetical protein
MRVEVEVYKGPLSKDPEIQWGELVGTLREAHDAIDTFQRFLVLQTRIIRNRIDNAMLNFPLQEMTEDLAQANDTLAKARIAARAFNRKYYETTQSLPFRDPTNARPENTRPALSDRILRELGDTCEMRYRFALSGIRADDVRPLLDRLNRCFEAAKVANPKTEPDRIAAEYFLERISQSIKDVRDVLEEAQIQVGLNALNDDLATAPDKVEASRRQLIAILSETAAVARQFRKKALFWSEAHVGFPLPLAELRRIPVSLATLLGTYADRIGNRADTLVKQVKGDDRREFPLSIALRETDTTAFLRQYVWNRAAVDYFLLERVTASSETTRNRVRGVERLFADENWTNINTVHASGQGTVRMALIKDDIGNWNLKSFDQDPTELLNAYKSVGLSALKIATEFAKTAVTSGTGAAALGVLQTANQIATGSAPGGSPTVGTADIASLRADLVKSLQAIRDKAIDDAKKLNTRITDLTAEQKTKKAAAESTQNDHETSVKARGVVEGETKKEQAAVAAIAVYKPIVEENERLANDTSLTEVQRNDRKTFAAENKTRLTAEESKRDASQALINSNKDNSDKLEARTKAKDEAAAASKKAADDLKKAEAERDGGLAAAALASAQQAIKDHEAVINALDTALSRKSPSSGVTSSGGASAPSGVPAVPGLPPRS